MSLLQKVFCVVIAASSGWFTLLMLNANVRGFFQLFILITFLFYLVYAANWRNNPFSKGGPKLLCFIVVTICLILSNYILFKEHIVLNNWSLESVVIEPSKLKNADSKGSEIWIDRITIDAHEKDILTQNSDANWLIRENQLMTMGDKPTLYQTDLKGDFKLVLSLRNHPWSGIAKITINESDKYSIDLYNGEVDKTISQYSFVTIKYVIIHNIFILLIVLSFCISLVNKIKRIESKSRIKLILSFSLVITVITVCILLYFEIEQAWWRIFHIIVISMLSSFLLVEFLNELIKKSNRSLTKFCFIVVPISLIILLLVEVINDKSLTEALLWIFDSWKTTAISLIVLGLFLLIFLFATNSIVLSFILVSFTFVSLAAINYYKVLIRSDVLVPWDMVLFTELGKINKEYSFSLYLPVLFSIMFIVFFSFYCRCFFEYRLSIDKKKRFVGLILSSTMVLLLMGFIMSSDMISKLNISEDELDQRLNYSNNGFIFGFIRNLNKTIEKPENYTSKTMNSLISTLPKNKKKNLEEENAVVKPNIILILNESYWDLGKLEKVKYNNTPNYLINSQLDGLYVLNLQVPQFAAGTANTEYEVLTGMDTAYYPTGAIPYKSYIKENLPSVVSYLKEQGYYTVAMHPYYADFYNRNKVYNYLGFDEKIFIDDLQQMDKGLTYFNSYVSDESLFNNIIKQYELHKMTNANGRFFNFTATMQNHSPYTEDVGDKTINIVGDNYSTTTKTILENYGEGIFRTDIALNRLYDFFGNQDDPTIIISFGDHLPGLGDVSQSGFTNVYHETGYLEEDNPNDKMYTTPLLIWANFSLKTEHFTENTIIKSEDLLPFVFNISGMRQPLYYQFVNTSNAPDSHNKDINDIRWLIQYDYQFGKGYVKYVIWE